MMTKEDIMQIEDGRVFAQGEFDSKGYSLTGGMRSWIALKVGDHWTIRWQSMPEVERIIRHGEPMDSVGAKKLLPVTDDAMELYRKTAGKGVSYEEEKEVIKS